MDKLYIVMPAYNEAANVRTVVSTWYPIVEKIGAECRLVIVDDGSKDDTYKILTELAAQYPQFIPLTKSNSGHGATCLYAYRYAIENQVDYVFQTDSDGQTLPEEFWLFWDEREKYDFLIGARKGRQDGWGRIMVTKVLKLVVWFVFGKVVADANTPFRLMKAEYLRSFLQKIPEDFFLANVMLSVLAVSEKLRIKWIPITFRPRQGGVNSINFRRIMKIGIKAVKDLREVKKRIRQNEV